MKVMMPGGGGKLFCLLFVTFTLVNFCGAEMDKEAKEWAQAAKEECDHIRTMRNQGDSEAERPKTYTPDGEFAKPEWAARNQAVKDLVEQCCDLEQDKNKLELCPESKQSAIADKAAKGKDAKACAGIIHISGLRQWPFLVGSFICLLTSKFH